MAKKSRSGFLFMFVIFLLLGVIIYTYRDRFSVLLNTGISSGKKIINEKFNKKDADKLANEKIDIMNKKNNDNNIKKDTKEKLFDNINDIKTNINKIKEKVSENESDKQKEGKIENEVEKQNNVKIIDDTEKQKEVKNINEPEKNENFSNITINKDADNKEDNTKLHYKDSKIYLSKLDNSENLIIVSVNRNVSYINTPLTETLKTLLEGPNNNERSLNFITNIPNNTKLLSVTVKDNTAYINFSNEFEYNSYGKDSTITQLKQVVYTATEFSNVKYVQILINGKIKKYLGGEGIIIEKPFSRSDFS